MSNPSLEQHTAEIAEIVRQVVRLRPHFKAMLLPGEVARARARLEKLSAEDGLGGEADYELLYNVGVILSRRESMTMGELGQALDVPLSTATRIVDVLVKSGYARRQQDPDDRRVVRVTLTDTGKEMYQIVDEFITQRVERILAHFTPEEREILIVLLRKLVRAVVEES